jgi:hypothetical protein
MCVFPVRPDLLSKMNSSQNQMPAKLRAETSPFNVESYSVHLQQVVPLQAPGAFTGISGGDSSFNVCKPRSGID